MGNLIVLEEGEVLVGFAISEETLDRVRQAASFTGMAPDKFMRQCLKDGLDEVEAAMGEIEATRKERDDG